MDFMLGILGYFSIFEPPLDHIRLPWWIPTGLQKDPNELDIAHAFPTSTKTKDLDEHYMRLWRIAYAILGDADLAHEAVCTAFLCVQQIPKVPERFWEYVSQAVRRRAIDLSRRRKSRRTETVATDLFDQNEGAVPSAEFEAIISERNGLLHTAVDSLPEPHRQTIILHYFEGMTQPQIAAVMEVPVYTVNNRLYVGRKMLRVMLMGTIGRDLGVTPELEPAA